MDCCQLLHSILDNMLKQQSSLEVVGAHLQTILASIMASLQANMQPTLPSTKPSPPASANQFAAVGDAGSDEALVKVVLRLTVEAPAALHASLRDVEPLLPLPPLEPACRCVSLLHLPLLSIPTCLLLQCRFSSRMHIHELYCQPWSECRTGHRLQPSLLFCHSRRR